MFVDFENAFDNGHRESKIPTENINCNKMLCVPPRYEDNWVKYLNMKLYGQQKAMTHLNNPRRT